MADVPDERIAELVERFLEARTDAASYLATVDPELRAEVAERLREAEFVAEYFTALPSPRRLPDRPQRIAGCDLLEPLGTGAMGEVYRARQQGLGRDVAVKLMRAELAHRDDFLLRFQKEARTLAALDHPGIVKVLFTGEEQGWLYFGMELIAGRSLDQAMPELRRSLAGREPRRFDRLVRLLAELLETLAYAHRSGIAHRDVKPSNVMLDDDGHPKLVDFGLSHEATMPGLTLPGVLVGTPAYLSPEGAMRRPRPRTADDLWAAGVILHELLTGALPYDGRTVDDTLQQLLHPRPIDPRAHFADVPANLAAICSRALDPDPAARYATAQQFAADLRRFLADEPVLAAQWSPWGAWRSHWRRRHRWYVAAAAGLAVGGASWFVAEQRAGERQLGAVVAALGEVVVDGVSLRDLAPHAATARSLLADERLSVADRATVAARLAAIEDLARARFAAAAQQIRDGAGSPRGTAVRDYRSPALAVQWKGLREATEAAMVLPALGDATALVAASQPVLHVADPEGGPGGAPFQVLALDPVTSLATPIYLGVTPCDVPVFAGHFRVVVGDANAFAELTRSIAVPGVYDLVANLLPTDKTHEGMVPVQAGQAAVGQSGEAAFVYKKQEITHPGFWIDRAEVTCGRYHAFCVATGATRLPTTWKNGYDPAWADLPVVGVTATEAAAFAEWAGKRLPTWTEWQIAARGRDGWEYPWGDDPKLLEDVTTLGKDARMPWHQAVSPPGSCATDTSWCGVVDMLANVEEWTETPYVAQLDGAPFPVLPWRLCGGVSWTRERDNFTELSVVRPGQPEQTATGFRCAKTSAP